MVHVSAELSYYIKFISFMLVLIFENASCCMQIIKFPSSLCLCFFPSAVEEGEPSEGGGTWDESAVQTGQFL